MNGMFSVVISACVLAVIGYGLIIFKNRNGISKAVSHYNRHVLLRATIVKRNMYHNAVGNYDYEAVCVDEEQHQIRFKINEGMYDFLKEGQLYTMICDGERIYHIDGYTQSIQQ